MLEKLSLKNLNEKELRKSLNFSQNNVLGINPNELVNNHLIADFMLRQTKVKKNSERVTKHWNEAFESSRKAIEARKTEVIRSLHGVECKDNYTNDKLWELKVYLGMV